MWHPQNIFIVGFILCSVAGSYEWEVPHVSEGNNDRLLARVKTILDKGVGVGNAGKSIR